MKRTFWVRTSLWAALLSSVFAVAQTATTKVAPTKVVAAAKKKSTAQQDPGERAFQANCNRCHEAPEQLSPRSTGTIVRHMRVRASLSAADEQAIVRYLAP